MGYDVDVTNNHGIVFKNAKVKKAGWHRAKES
jgi:hypothetical protein